MKNNVYSKPMPAVSLHITGKVQGVFYRANATARAQELGVKGWVKNLPDGSVEVHAEGAREAIEQFVQWARKGPPSAEVADVEVHEVPEQKLPYFQAKRD